MRDSDIITVLTFAFYHQHTALCDLELGHFLSKV